ncbi:hypothetical protein AX16_010047 [Volvariella volvacea WC 439]|nr:hypothetical protein AX16_010047 [Volvariella volvacea WC 439]
MFSKLTVFFVALSALSVTEPVFGRERWLERDNRPVFLHPRRFGQENPGVLQRLGNACNGAVCGTLAGRAVTPLLAAQPECSQQDMADDIIDASRQFDAATQQLMIEIAREYRQAEKNTPPDFTTNPPSLRNSVFCQRAPRNPELNGLVQAQDPNNDPNLFFDPATKSTVLRGSQPNTFPFGTNGNGGGNAQPVAPPAAPAPAQPTQPAPAPSPVTTTAAQATNTPAAPSPAPAPPQGGNLQTFTGALGDIQAPTVTALANGEFQVTNNASFKTLLNARNRSCDVQHNLCANQANANRQQPFSVGDCGQQLNACKANASASS